MLGTIKINSNPMPWIGGTKLHWNEERFSDGKKDALLSELDRIADLPENWDGCGAPKVALCDIVNAKILIGKTIKNLDLVKVSPWEFGGVYLRIRTKDKEHRMGINLVSNTITWYYEVGGKIVVKVDNSIDVANSIDQISEYINSID